MTPNTTPLPPGPWDAVLFLDLDGVLNGHVIDPDSGINGIDTRCVRNLNRVLRFTGARVVLSSAWRYMVHGGAMTCKGFQYMLQTHGMVGTVGGSTSVVVGLTAKDEDVPDRPAQVRAWLKVYGGPGQRYVVLDDMDFCWGDLNVVMTDGRAGLTGADADRAIAALTGRAKGDS